MAETARFELAVAVTRHDGLANRWFQPLTHVSGPGGEAQAYNERAQQVQPGTKFIRAGKFRRSGANWREIDSGHRAVHCMDSQGAHKQRRIERF
jgi:hypothetical protein